MAIGDELGSPGRQNELKAIREEAKKSQEAVNFLNESIKQTQRQLAEVGGKDFMKTANTNVDSLSKRLSEVTVESLKSAKSRKTFENDLTKALEQQAANEAVLVNLKREREALIPLISAAEQKAALAREQGETAYKQTIGDTESKLNAATEERKRLLEEVGVASAAGDENRVKQLSEEIGRVNDVISERKKLYDDAKVNADLSKQQAENRAKNYEQEAKDLSQQSSLYQAQSNQLAERNQLLTQSIDSGKQLANTIREINQATPAFIEAFEKFGEVAAAIPIIGPAFNAITKDISKASAEFKKLKAEGKSSISAIMQAVKGFTFATLTASLIAFVDQAVKGAKTASEAFVTLNKSVAGTTVSMADQMSKVTAAASKFSIPLAEAAQTIAGLNTELGVALDYTSETTEQAILLANKYQVSGGAVANLVKLSGVQNTSLESIRKNIELTTARFNEQNGVSLSAKAIMEDIGTASASVLRNVSKQPGGLAAAAASARMLGMSMQEIQDAAKGTLDFQSSLSTEMETEMMLGKQLNLNKLREAALTGDVKTQAEEMKKLVMENASRIGDNVLLQEQFAKTIGLTADQYNAILNNEDAYKVLTEKSGAAQQANAENKKKSDAEVMASLDKTIGKLSKLTDKIAKFQEDMSLGAYDFAQGILAGFDGGFFEGIKNIGSMIGDEFGKMTEMGFTNYIKSGSNVGKLLGVLGVGGAGVLTLKAASGLGKSLFGGFKLFGKADGSSPNKGLWVRSVGDKAKGILNKLTGKKGDLVKSATSPTGFRDAAGRFAKAPTGGGGGGGMSMMSAVGKGIGDFAKGIGKGIQGILGGLAKGIAAFANPQVVLGAGALALSIVQIGAGIAGASWLMGKALPTLAEGMQSIAELDGDALIKAGKGIGAVGLGMAAMGAGGAMGAVGGLIGGISSLFGGPSMSDMFKKVEEFGKNYNFDPVRLENNARGIAAYAAGMAALAGGSAASTIGSLANIGGGLADGLMSMFGGKLPMDKVQDFAKYNLDPEKVGNNAKAVAFYAAGMAALAGGSAASTVGSLANIGGSLADGLVSMFGGSLPMDKVEKFQKYNLDPDRVGKNSKAVAFYALGMAALAGGSAASFVGSLANIGSSLADGLVSLFGGKLPLDKVEEFQKYDFDPEKVGKNAKAVASYALGMSALAASDAVSFLGSLGNMGSQLVNGLVGAFGGSTGIPYDKLKELQEANLDGEKIHTNATALGSYAKAMALLAASNAGSFLGALGNAGAQLVDGLVSFFGGSTGIPYDKIKEFANADINASNLKKNGDALAAFGKGMSSLEDFDDFADDFADGISDLEDGIDDFNGLKSINMSKLSSLTVAAEGLAKFSKIDMGNAGEVIKDLTSFAQAVGAGVLKVDIAATTLFETEIDTLKSVINDTSRNEIAELRKQNETMNKNHNKELVELRNQTALLFDYIQKPKNSIIKMNSFKVGQAVTKI